MQINTLGTFLHHWDPKTCLTYSYLKSWKPECRYIKEYNTRLCQVLVLFCGQLMVLNEESCQKRKRCPNVILHTQHRKRQIINWKKMYICHTYHQQRISIENIQRTTINLQGTNRMIERKGYKTWTTISQKRKYTWSIHIWGSIKKMHNEISLILIWLAKLRRMIWIHRMARGTVN